MLEPDERLEPDKSEEADEIEDAEEIEDEPEEAEESEDNDEADEIDEADDTLDAEDPEDDCDDPEESETEDSDEADDEVDDADENDDADEKLDTLDKLDREEADEVEDADDSEEADENDESDDSEDADDCSRSPDTPAGLSAGPPSNPSFVMLFNATPNHVMMNVSPLAGVAGKAEPFAISTVKVGVDVEVLAVIAQATPRSEAVAVALVNIITRPTNCPATDPAGEHALVGTEVDVAPAATVPWPTTAAPRVDTTFALSVPRFAVFAIVPASPVIAAVAVTSPPAELVALVSSASNTLASKTV